MDRNPSPSNKQGGITTILEKSLGAVAKGGSIAARGRDIFDMIRAVASGLETKLEALGLGENEFVPWQFGALM